MQKVLWTALLEVRDAFHNADRFPIRNVLDNFTVAFRVALRNIVATVTTRIYIGIRLEGMDL